jgi:hypothetical protein
MDHAELATLYGDLARLVRPGGLFVNCDHQPANQDSEVLTSLSKGIQSLNMLRAGVINREDWSTWWDAANTAPEFAALVAERQRRGLSHLHDGNVGVAEQAESLRAAGFAEVGSVWQFGADHMLVGVR